MLKLWVLVRVTVVVLLTTISVCAKAQTEIVVSLPAHKTLSHMAQMYTGKANNYRTAGFYATHTDSAEVYSPTQYNRMQIGS